MGMVTEFKEFAMRGNVVDLAVGVVIGAAFGKIVASLVNDIIMPMIGFIVGGVNFNELAFELKPATVDAAGFLWTPLVRTGQLARFAPDGQLDRLLDLPATHPTSLCIGGTDLRTAYITSISRSTHLVGDRPDDGGLFELRGLPVPGLPAQLFDDRLWSVAAQSG